jgi:hypothetical protein
MFANFVNGADVGMVQSGSGPGFTAKTLERLRVVRDVVRQELKGDKAAQGGVLCPVDHTHPAPTKLLDDAVVRDDLADQKRETPPLGPQS